MQYPKNVNPSPHSPCAVLTIITLPCSSHASAPGFLHDITARLRKDGRCWKCWVLKLKVRICSLVHQPLNRCETYCFLVFSGGDPECNSPFSCFLKQSASTELPLKVSLGTFNPQVSVCLSCLALVGFFNTQSLKNLEFKMSFLHSFQEMCYAIQQAHNLAEISFFCTFWGSKMHEIQETCSMFDMSKVQTVNPP